MPSHASYVLHLIQNLSPQHNLEVENLLANLTSDTAIVRRWTGRSQRMTRRSVHYYDLSFSNQNLYIPVLSLNTSSMGCFHSKPEPVATPAIHPPESSQAFQNGPADAPDVSPRLVLLTCCHPTNSLSNNTEALLCSLG